MNGFESAGRRGRNSLHDLASLIRRAIVYGDHFVIVVFEGKQARERSPDVSGFIAGGNDDADPRIFSRLAIPLRTGNIWDFLHSYRRVGETPEPGQTHKGFHHPM